ncbi:MAG TPA: asparagine synthetase B, partial [bacterium]|nr:asparagine synthetase B [bacterium]
MRSRGPNRGSALAARWILAVLVAALAVGVLAVPHDARADKILVYMDLAQTDHLKAYGLAYWCLEQGLNVEWLLNYRAGSFMIDANDLVARKATLMGVAFDLVPDGQVAEIYSTIERENMEVVLLEKAPAIAVYTPPEKEPWDDAVMLALDYAEIPYTKIYDEEVLAGDLENYDWLHLHHEDFTGQYGKFYSSYRDADWYKQQVASSEAMAKKLGFTKVSELKKAVARKIKEYIGRGGFVFTMCSGTDSFDIALAAENDDIVANVFDGDPPDPHYQEKLDYSKTLAFTNFKVIPNPLIYEYSDIDTTPKAVQRGQANDYFTLFDFSAKQDPIPTMLTQDHVAVINGFMGQTTGFEKSLIKKSVTIMAETEGEDDVKYLHGAFGKGTFTFYGGHD